MVSLHIDILHSIGKQLQSVMRQAILVQGAKILVYPTTQYFTKHTKRNVNILLGLRFKCPEYIRDVFYM